MLVYTVEDSAGNKGSAERTVEISCLMEPGEELTIMLPGDLPFVLVRIPAGTFMMGRYTDEPESTYLEDPQHQVTLTQDFYMGKYEVTQAQWLAMMDTWPETAPSALRGLGDDYPAYNVSWDDVQDFITALNTHLMSTVQDTVTVRLPSEAEWEYACRAGTTTRFYSGDSPDCIATDCSDCAAGVLPGNQSSYMWYCYNATKSMPVGGNLPNAAGLYDMHGNIFEWCQDGWSAYTSSPVTDPTGPTEPVPDVVGRVRRGGYWNDQSSYCRSAVRSASGPNYWSYAIGFRLAAVPVVR